MFLILILEKLSYTVVILLKTTEGKTAVIFENSYKKQFLSILQIYLFENYMMEIVEATVPWLELLELFTSFLWL